MGFSIQWERDLSKRCNVSPYLVMTCTFAAITSSKSCVYEKQVQTNNARKFEHYAFECHPKKNYAGVRALCLTDAGEM